MKQNKGFTLIELLIVVAIIAILAAIAVPNFLEAQTRAKVSRAKSDLRTLAVGMEAYAVDWNNAPPEAGGGPGTGVFAPRVFGTFNNQTGIMSTALSTPVAYLTNADLRDPFFSNDSAARPDVALFTYKAYKWEWPKGNPVIPDTGFISYGETTSLTGAKFREIYGDWRIFSVGPDRVWDNKFPKSGTNISSPSSIGLPYDPTNGTVSLGSILRSQAQSEQKTWSPVAGQ